MFAPTTFGKYYLFEKLATGGMAEIYKGKLLGPGGFEKILVIKQILPELARRRGFIELFVEEAKTTVSLSHGNIVPIYELGVMDGTYYTAMEFIDGPTLYELERAAIRADKLIPIDLGVAIVLEVLKGLDYAHRKVTASGGLGVVHRDLSPRNVMVSREGEVKILDFGIAIAGEGGEGELAGSYAYMSPEQAKKEPVDSRTDLFACGTLLWELVTGKSLFARETPEETLAAVRAAAAGPPSAQRSGVPPEIDEACARALAASRANRAASAQDLIRPLMRWLYARFDPPGPKAIAAWVEDNCPRGLNISDAPQTQVSRGPDILATRPVDDGGDEAPAQVTFATNVQLVEILSRPASTMDLISVPQGDAVLASSPRKYSDQRTPFMGVQARAEVLGEEARPEVRRAVTLPPTAVYHNEARGSGPVVVDSSNANDETAPIMRSDLPALPAAPAQAQVLKAGRRWLVLPLLLSAVAAAFVLWRLSLSPGKASLVAPDAGSAVVAVGYDAGRPRLDAGTDRRDARVHDAGARPDAALRRRDGGAGHARRDATAASTGGGNLNVGANPYALVTIDGERRGGTPVRSTALSVGKHRVKLVCPASACPPAGQSFEFTVDVADGETLRRAVDFTGPEPALIE